MYVYRVYTRLISLILFPPLYFRVSKRIALNFDIKKTGYNIDVSHQFITLFLEIFDKITLIPTYIFNFYSFLKLNKKWILILILHCIYPDLLFLFLCFTRCTIIKYKKRVLFRWEDERLGFIISFLTLLSYVKILVIERNIEFNRGERGDFLFAGTSQETSRTLHFDERSINKGLNMAKNIYDFYLQYSPVLYYEIAVL